jgi:hypothetical protein
MSLQRSHHTYPGEHLWPIVFCDQQKRFRRGLPFRRLLFGFRQLGDVGPGVFERHKLATARQRYRIVERRFHPLVAIRRTAPRLLG